MRKENRKLVIDFLYLDLSSCRRCQATDRVLDHALDEMRGECTECEHTPPIDRPPVL